MAVIFDMFGEPVSDKAGQRGRPEHVPTAENVNKVRALVLAGWKVAAIAAEIGISAPTLRKVYFRDLERARRDVLAVARGKLLIQLQEQAAGGSVTAMKALWTILEKEALKDLPAAMKPGAAKERPGKKQRQKMAARQPTGGWEDLLPATADKGTTLQ